MNPIDLLILACVAVILGLAGGFVILSKKRGKGCIGCPDSGNCSGNCCGCPYTQEK